MRQIGLAVGLGFAVAQGAACSGESARSHPQETPSGAAGNELGAGGSAGHTGGVGGTQGGRGGSSTGGQGTSGAAPVAGRGSGGAAGRSGAGGEAGGPAGEAGAAGASEGESFANPERGIERTALDVQLDAYQSVATLTLAPSTRSGMTLEVLDLEIQSVTISGLAVAFVAHRGVLEVDVPASSDSLELRIAYRFATHSDLRGYSPDGFTFTWPYYCGNLFPCRSEPADGTTFHLTVAGGNGTLVYPTEIPFEVPSYVMAWARGNYAEIALGTTSAGTSVSAFYLADELDGKADAELGTARLRDVFEWYEGHLGGYELGSKVGPVAVRWPGNAYGGIEHHPLWHVAVNAMKDPLTHAHEAAHGWFGDGVRLRCWEDFVLSEGTASYLAARVLAELGETEAAEAAWDRYTQDVLAPGAFAFSAWPEGCGQVDVLTDGLYSDATYARGAFFYRSLEGRIGGAAVEMALHDFYETRKGEAQGVQDLLDAIQTTTGYDASACAEAWLRSIWLPPFDPCE
jgi:aminopeptidase N